MRIWLLLLSGIFWALAPLGKLTAGDFPPGAVAEGEPFRGQFIAADAGGALRFETNAGARTISPGDLVRWGRFVEPGGGVQVILADGGVIVVDAAKIEKEQLQATSPTFGDVALPLELIAGIIRRPPSDLAARDALAARVVAPGGQSDRLLLDNGDELTGTIGGWDDKAVSLETDAGKTVVEIDKISAIIFNPTLVHKSRASGPRILVGFRDGSRLTAIELSAEQAGARLKLAGGAELKSPLDAIVGLQPLGGRVTYLSDLKPASYRHVPYLQLAWPFQPDRSVLGSQLRADGQIYCKGLGMHSPSRVTYDLDRPFRRFEAELAIDASAQSRGSVVFRVFTDDASGGWQERAASPVMRGGQPPVPISVDLTGARRLSLLVDYADRGDELDHADWLDARLVR